MKKINEKTKKIIILSVMVALLVATGVLNVVLNKSLDSGTSGTANVGADTGVTETFFASYRSDREATRDSEFLYLDAIVGSDVSTETAKAAAETEKLMLVSRMEQELQIETLVKSKGFDDAIVTISENGVNVVVNVPELTSAEVAQILTIVTDETEFSAKDVKIIPYE